MKKTCYTVIVLALFFALSACTSSQSASKAKSKAESAMYTKYNLHVHYKSSSDIKSHYANWTGPYPGHRIIPPGTPVTVLSWSRGFILKRIDTGEKIRFTFNQKHMAMDKKTYIDKILTPVRVSVDHFSAVDQQGIREGKALTGMTREGVMTALGYPATHKTPSLDNDEWIYWTNRFGTFAVIFDDNDKVKGIRD